MKEVHQYGDKSVYVEQHTGNIIIQHPGGAIVLNPNTAEGIEQLRQELGAQMERILDLLKHPAGNKPPRHLTNPPFDTAFFIGREADLEAIEATYQQHSRLLVLVNGEGGIGKTTLAAKYWHAHAARYRHLAWLYADAGIGSALLSLRDQLDVKFGPQDSFEAQVQRIAVALNNLDAPCLLVFDNANDAADLRQHYTLLHRLSTCHILLTSRVRNAREMQVHEVQPLSASDALRLFRHYYPGIDEAELPMLQAILHAVGLNTLVIELLAKNLALLNRFALRYSLAEMLADLQGKGLLALKSKTVELVYGSDTLRSAEPGEVIAAMYDLAKLNEAACHLLSNLAVLPAENLPYDLLVRLLDADPEALESTLSSLEEAGWLEYRSADNSFKISPVVQEVTRHKHAARLLQDCRTLIHTLTAGLDEDNRHQDNYRQAAVYARLG
ncbi:MAG: NACHT domain-containing protein, partial [Bacteroidia bacterium]|nr:NACHT domain-containing protein [Bacteroidia bacterium]